MRTKYNPLATIIIANYNNEVYLKKCLDSVLNQKYKKIEVIVVDDYSNDNSLNILNKYKNSIKIIKNKKKTKYGSFNQINAYQLGFKKSKGKIIFFLDSDDFFHKNKIEKITNLFLNDRDKMIVFDFPIILKNEMKIKSKKKNNFFKTYWGYIHPTSCITIRKKFTDEVFNSIQNENFTNIWLDLRILLFSKYINRYDVINENLTYYRQTEENVSSKFKKFSKSWWRRRNEAHDYFLSFMRKNNIKFKKNLDYYLTKIVNIFI